VKTREEIKELLNLNTLPIATFHTTDKITLSSFKGTSGVYGIINNTSNKIYIGSSFDICRRIKEHLRLTSNGLNSNLNFRYALKKQ
jgi:hypothetical protein